MFCNNCGEDIGDAEICPNCGFPQNEEEPINDSITENYDKTTEEPIKTLKEEPIEETTAQNMPLEDNDDTIFCTNCGKKIIENLNFCPNCGQPLNSFSDDGISNQNEEVNNNIKQPRKFNKNYGKTPKNKNKNNTKIIVPVAIISILLIISILVVGTMLFITVSNNNSLKILNISEKITGYSSYSDYSAKVTIEFSPVETIENIRTISIDNMLITYDDGSTLENQYVKDLGGVKDIGGIDDIHNTKLNKGGDYELYFTTEHSTNTKITHIEGDIIAHTTLDGDFKIGHFDKNVTLENPYNY